MASTLANAKEPAESRQQPGLAASQELLQAILAGRPWTDSLLTRALREGDGRALFSVVVERLGDLFEPRLCDEYARLFARVIELVRPELDGQELLARYLKIRAPRVCEREPDEVFVLSRITLGADVAVTSVLLHAVKRRFPSAAIRFVGPEKNWQLFRGDSRILHLPLDYPRSGTLQERLNTGLRLSTGRSIVVDPDSRITQLGLLPVCPDEEYWFFESRSFGGDGNAALPELASSWAERVFETSPSRAYVAPLRHEMSCDVAVSFGVGENPEKRLDDVFEEELLKAIASRGWSIVVDKGAGGEEAERVQRLASRVPGLQVWEGPYAPFASMISEARLYVGYDSAGQHVAAACGVPLISIFAGYASDRMFERWKAYGPGPKRIIKVVERDRDAILSEVRSALDELGPSIR